MSKIQGTYINDFGKESGFEIEDGVITHSNMGDDYDDFINLINQKMENNIKELDKKHKEFTELCKPLIKWLNDNHHPHTQIIITTTTCELMEGLIAGEVLDFIKD